MFGNLDSEKGFGLIHVLASLLIVTVALVGLFISINFARNRANENYHFRSALLIASGKMEFVKYVNRDMKSPDISNLPAVFYAPVVLDERDNQPPLTATVSINKTFIVDKSSIDVAPYVGYDSVIIQLTWKEPSSSLIPSQASQVRTVTLREDYYWKFTQ